jgi:hypothetical protein
MSVTWHVTDEAMRLIRSAARGNSFKQTAVREGDGWRLEVTDDTAERLEAIRLQGESISDCIVRLVSFYASGGKAH